jgi:hypothetical protein
MAACIASTLTVSGCCRAQASPSHLESFQLWVNVLLVEHSRTGKHDASRLAHE